MKILCINNGYANIKSENRQIFSSKIGEISHKDFHMSGDILTLDGKSYVIGEGEPALELDKTKNLNTKLLILNMCCRFTGEKETFKLVLSSPPALSVQQSEVLPLYLIGEYNIEHNGVYKKIIINDIYVVPETVTAYLSNNVDGKYQNKICVVWDIGGRTTNIVRLTDGNFTDKDIITIPRGMYHIDNEIAEYITSNHLKTIDSNDVYWGRISGIENTQGKNIFETDKEEIENIYMQHIKEIEKRYNFKGWDILNYEILITGGGGKILFDTIKSKYNRAKLSNDPLFDNLKGLEIVSKWVYGND